jgi:hypothetical protein
MVTDAQVRVMRQKRMDGKTQEAAAAAGDMSVRTAREWETGVMPSQSKPTRHWRTRGDPFETVWESEVVPLLTLDDKGVLEGTTVLEWLREQHPGKYDWGQLRTLQRRVRDWRALHGPEQEVYFQQVHPPGREAAFDFTNCNALAVTIAGEPFAHLLFELVLSHSGWTWVALAFGENFETLVMCVQGALWELGGVPTVLRSDNLSAATHELREGGRGLNKRFRAVLEHYGLRSTRIQAGKAHENGVVEQRHFRTKTLLEQALVLRGSRDFASEATYQQWVREQVERGHNAKLGAKLDADKQALQALPSSAIPSYTTVEATVRSWSTVHVGKRTYSVVSRLIGHRVTLRVHPTEVEVYYQEKLVEAFPRLRGEQLVRIDYRHVIWSLVRKPGAFTRYRYREEMFPSVVFRRAHDALRSWYGERADVEYVRILHLAASTREAEVEAALAQCLGGSERFDYAGVKDCVRPEKPSIPVLEIGRPDLAAYDALLVGGAS